MYGIQIEETYTDIVSGLVGYQCVVYDGQLTTTEGDFAEKKAQQVYTLCKTEGTKEYNLYQSALKQTQYARDYEVALRQWGDARVELEAARKEFKKP